MEKSSPSAAIVNESVDTAELIRIAAKLLQMAATFKVAPTAPPAGSLVPVTTASLESYALGPAAVRAAIERSELRGVQGSRRRLCVYEADLIAWRDSRPVKVHPRRRANPLENEDPIDQMLRSGELRRSR